MAVYVDDFQRKIVIRPYQLPWKMSHMIADTRGELDAMAEELELNPKWKQRVGENKEHYDVTENFRLRAIKLGAKPITVRELVKRLVDRDLKAYLEG